MDSRVKRQVIVLESNQNHATISMNGICPTLTASMGLGGGYIPMVTVEIKEDTKDENIWNNQK